MGELGVGRLVYSAALTSVSASSFGVDSSERGGFSARSRSAAMRRRRFITLPVPAGYPDLAAFNRAFAAAIRGHPNRRSDWDPSKRAIRGGAIVTDVLKHDDPAIRGFARSLAAVLERYVRDLPPRAGDPGHPHLRAIPKGYALDAWANILDDGGHHSGHIHNLGWLSGVYYV